MGRLVSAGDREALVEALSELAEFEELRRVWGENARQMVRTEFLTDDAADRYDQALRRRLRSL